MGESAKSVMLGLQANAPKLKEEELGGSWLRIWMGAFPRASLHIWSVNV